MTGCTFLNCWITFLLTIGFQCGWTAAAQLVYATTCPIGYSYTTTYEVSIAYQMYKGSINYDDAVSACLDIGMKPARVDNPDRMKTLFTEMGKAGITSAWIGLEQRILSAPTAVTSYSWYDFPLYTYTTSNAFFETSSGSYPWFPGGFPSSISNSSVALVHDYFAIFQLFERFKTSARSSLMQGYVCGKPCIFYTEAPTPFPTPFPTLFPTTETPTSSPNTSPPSNAPVVLDFTESPTLPSLTNNPTIEPSFTTVGPSPNPSVHPSSAPTAIPSLKASYSPSMSPTAIPSSKATDSPSTSTAPIASSNPSDSPSAAPTAIPTSKPSGFQSFMPTASPHEGVIEIATDKPTTMPTPEPATVYNQDRFAGFLSEHWVPFAAAAASLTLVLLFTVVAFMIKKYQQPSLRQFSAMDQKKNLPKAAEPESKLEIAHISV